MAKKKQTRTKSRRPTKRASSHPFMEARPDVLTTLLSTAGKKSQRDQAGSRFVSRSVGPTTGKPGERED